MSTWAWIVAASVMWLGWVSPSAADLIADSVAEFSDVQGQDSWFYGYYDGDSDTPFSTNDFEEMGLFGVIPPDVSSWHVDWFGSPGFWTAIDAEACSPNGEVTSGGRTPIEHWAVRRWVSEISTTILISGHVADMLGEPGDGVVVRIIVDGSEVWSQPIADGNTTGFDYDVSVDVTEGALVDFAVSPNVSDWTDGTRFTVAINVADPVESTTWGTIKALFN